MEPAVWGFVGVIVGGLITGLLTLGVEPPGLSQEARIEQAQDDDDGDHDERRDYPVVAVAPRYLPAVAVVRLRVLDADMLPLQERFAATGHSASLGRRGRLLLACCRIFGGTAGHVLIVKLLKPMPATEPERIQLGRLVTPWRDADLDRLQPRDFLCMQFIPAVP
jgi:hypothetical protein